MKESPDTGNTPFRRIFSLQAATLMLLFCSIGNAQQSEPALVPGTKHLDLFKKFISNPKWKVIKRQLKNGTNRESTLERKEKRREERGYLPLHSRIKSGEKLTTKVLYVAAGTPSKVKYVLTGFLWKFPRSTMKNRESGQRSPNASETAKAANEKRVAVTALMMHKKQFAAAGFKIVDQKDNTVPGWIRLQYRLRYKKTEFTVLVKHEGSGMHFDFASSQGGYVHFQCCLKPEDCAD